MKVNNEGITDANFNICTGLMIQSRRKIVTLRISLHNFKDDPGADSFEILEVLWFSLTSLTINYTKGPISFPALYDHTRRTSVVTKREIMSPNESTVAK